MSEQPLPNIGRDLRRIHRVITRGLAVLQERGAEVASGGFPDEPAREGFWKYCRGLEANTHGHHLTEDEVFFPFVRSRLPAADYRRLAAEHEQMVGILEAVKSAREAGSAVDLLSALGRMAALWHAHIIKEETWFSPEVMAHAMTVPEHVDMAQKAAAHSSAHAQPAPLAVPFLLYNLEGEDREHFLRVMPAEVTQHLVPVVWKEEWATMEPLLLP